MKFNFYILFFCLAFIGFTSYSQAPNQPVNPVPANQGGTGTLNPNLCATVSDPNGGTIQVKYSGRVKTTNSSEKFTIILLPDTQFYTEEPQGNHDGGNAAMFNAQTDWIANNRLSKNIVYVGQLGDCVQNGDNPPGSNKQIEWQRAQAAISTIESQTKTGLSQGIPFGICVGNHDQSPIGSATGTTTYYNQYFGSSHFTGRDYYGGHYGSNNDNHYQLFTASGIDFLIISLEYDQTAAFASAGGPLAWAEGLVQNNPKRKVMVLTHWALNENASFSTQGQAIYNRLRSYSNFSFLMGGHVSSASGGEARRTDIYNGNRAHTILTDYQSRPGGGNGLLRIYEFDPSLNKVSVKTYSPYTGLYETDPNSQFELSFNMMPVIGQVNNVSSGTAPCYNWTDLLYETNYEWGMELYDGQNITMGPLWSFLTPTQGSLPITWLDFFAIIENQKVKLSWKTANEFNNVRFEIERSKDGGSFSKVGEIAGRGNSTVLQQYSFYDEQPIPGKIFYRLKQVDIDGHFTYSDIQSVLLDDPRTVIFYPNPVSGSGIINIYFAKPVRRQIKVVIHDMSGRELFSETKNNVQNNIQIKPNLSRGIYIVQLIGETLRATEKIMVVNKAR